MNHAAKIPNVLNLWLLIKDELLIPISEYFICDKFL